MTPGQKKRLEAARRAAKSAKDRADYDARRVEEARQAGIKARTAEEAKAALEAREAERAQLRREREILQREVDRIDAERWRKDREEREAREKQDAANMADAHRSQNANGNDRAYCRLDVSSGVRCWLLPGHEGRCLPEPPRPVKGGGGRGLGLLLMAAALWGAA